MSDPTTISAQLIYSVTDEAQLNAALVQIAAESTQIAVGQTLTIDLSGASIALTTALEAVNVAVGTSLVINGGGGALDGMGDQRGLFVYSGDVTVQNLAIDDTAAIGGNAQYNVNAEGIYAGTGGGGGGGAGLGGGLFVAGTANGAAAPASVTLDDVTFADDRAQGGIDADPFVVGSDGAGGTAVLQVPTIYEVADEAQLNTALGIIDQFGAGLPVDTKFTIDLPGGDLALDTALQSVSLAVGDSLLINGAGTTLDGGGTQAGLIIDAGNVTLDNLTIANAVAQGAIGGAPGLGGGLFAGAPSDITLNDVVFQNDSAIGGAGAASGAGNSGFGQGGGVGALGGFGAGNGATSAGGGGLGAGGDIFVQSGASLLIDGGGLASGTVSGGAAGAGAQPGQAYGDGIFLQGSATVGIASATGQTLTIAGAIADQTGSGGADAFAGAGGVVIGDPSGADDGTVIFTGDNDYTGGTSIMSGALEIGASGGGTIAGGVTLAAGTTLESDTGGATDISGSITGAGAVAQNGGGGLLLSGANAFSGGLYLNAGSADLLNASAAGDGVIQFGTASGLELRIGDGDAPANIISGFAGFDTIDLQGIGLATGVTLAAGNTLDVTGDFGTIALRMAPGDNLAGDVFTLGGDGAGGTDIVEVPSVYVVSNETQLNDAILSIAQNGSLFPTGTAFTIDIATSDLLLQTPLEAINLIAGQTLTINGQGNTLDGGGAQRGLFIYSGTVTVDNLTIANADAQGGNGYSGGGGGAGLGGGLFVAGADNDGPAPGVVTLDNVTFTNDSAHGGNGGLTADSPEPPAAGGGGGMGGDAEPDSGGAA